MRSKMRSLITLCVSVFTVGLIATACSWPSNSGWMDGSHMSGDVSADAMFAQMMIPHHEQAVVMADLAATRAQDPVIVDLAAEIKATQNPEIELMSSWLEEWGVPRMPMGEAMSAHGAHGMAGMLSDEQLDELAAASGDNFDRMFAQLMIEHHEGAISMARDVLENGDDPRATALAREIIATQEKEILQMQTFLNGATSSLAMSMTPSLTHVHAAVVSGEGLLAATHDGLHLVDVKTGETTRVGTSRDDFMALGGNPNATLVASGHPGPGSTADDPLGLVTSSDSGRTWTGVSLGGEVDFHALSSQGSVIVGWDTRGPLQVSRDGGRTWSAGPSTTATSLAWFDDQAWIAHPDNGLMTWRPGETELREMGVPGVLVAVSPDGGAMWRMDREGAVFRSVHGELWQEVGRVNQVEAFAADRDVAYAVTASGIQIVAL